MANVNMHGIICRHSDGDVYETRTCLHLFTFKTNYRRWDVQKVSISAALPPEVALPSCHSFSELNEPNCAKYGKDMANCRRCLSSFRFQTC